MLVPWGTSAPFTVSVLLSTVPLRGSIRGSPLRLLFGDLQWQQPSAPVAGAAAGSMIASATSIANAGRIQASPLVNWQTASTTSAPGDVTFCANAPQSAGSICSGVGCGAFEFVADTRCVDLSICDVIVGRVTAPATSVAGVLAAAVLLVSVGLLRLSPSRWRSTGRAPPPGWIAKK